MDVIAFVIVGYAIFTSLVWLWGFGFILMQLYAAPKISKVDAPAPDTYPSLSVLVPACNEAETIETALRSLLTQDYPNMEVIAIDDRSNDETGSIIERLSEEYEKLRAVHIEELPDGWIGKTHALKNGYEQSEGEWVLMTDADVCYKPAALRSIMAVALYDNLDQISCLPEVQNSGFWHEVAFNGFVSLVVGIQNLKGVRDNESDDYFGFGAFNMVRKAVFDKTPGFGWLRMEITDDMGVAKMMNDHAARQGFYFAFDQLSLEWYGALTDMISGLEKNSIAVLAHYNYLKGFGIPLVWALLFMGPIIGLFSSLPAVQVISAGAYLCSIPFNIIASRRLERPVYTFLFSIFGVWILMYALIRSTAVCALRGGVRWRSTFYPVEELREKQRVKF